MLKPIPAHDAVPICWTCGQPGAHGTADECIAALKRAKAERFPDEPKPVTAVQRDIARAIVERSKRR